MANYKKWKIKKSVINYSGTDEDLQEQSQKAIKEYSEVADWCNQNQEYHIEDTGDYYTVVKNPDPTPPTFEEVRQMRIRYRQEHIDDKTAERSRKMANSTWSDEDEQAYLALDAEVTAWINENLPYPTQGE